MGEKAQVPLRTHCDHSEEEEQDWELSAALVWEGGEREGLWAGRNSV